MKWHVHEVTGLNPVLLKWFLYFFIKKKIIKSRLKEPVLNSIFFSPFDHLLMSLIALNASSMLPMVKKKLKFIIASREVLSPSSNPAKSRITCLQTDDLSLRETPSLAFSPTYNGENTKNVTKSVWNFFLSPKVQGGFVN